MSDWLVGIGNTGTTSYGDNVTINLTYVMFVCEQ